MNLLHAAILGIVEGLTEFLPVSSTGHLILTGNALRLEGAGIDAFEIVIQLGALLAVVVHYRRLLAERLGGLLHKDPRAVRLLVVLLSAFVPTAIVGLAVGKAVKRHLFAPLPVAIALAVGGVLMIVIELALKKRPARVESLEAVTPTDGVFIGLVQCLSLIPGTSRSMTTILAGRIRGLSGALAAELSFLIALPTLGAATLYEGWKDRHDLALVGGPALAVGMIVSFFVAWAVIAGFLRYLGKHGLAPFGVYRVVLAAIVLLVGF